MKTINPDIEKRLTAGIKKFQPILHKAKLSSKNESDTVTIITDILCEMFGYDKYDGITSELPIKRSFCDLALKQDDQIKLLMECKAVGVELQDVHIAQATGYAANAGVDWVALTNGIDWRIYRVVFSKPIETIQVYQFNFCELDAKHPASIRDLYALCVEAFQGEENKALELLYSQQQNISRYIIGQVMLNDWMIETIRRSLQRHFPSTKISNEELRRTIRDEIFRPEIVTGKLAASSADIVASANAKMKERQQKKGTACAKTCGKPVEK